MVFWVAEAINFNNLMDIEINQIDCNLGNNINTMFTGLE